MFTRKFGQFAEQQAKGDGKAARHGHVWDSFGPNDTFCPRNNTKNNFLISRIKFVHFLFDNSRLIRAGRITDGCFAMSRERVAAAGDQNERRHIKRIAQCPYSFVKYNDSSANK
jgi:hypothetical protein